LEWFAKRGEIIWKHYSFFLFYFLAGDGTTTKKTIDSHVVAFFSNPSGTTTIQNLFPIFWPLNLTNHHKKLYNQFMHPLNRYWSNKDQKHLKLRPDVMKAAHK
jgi:hypothetical protein